MFLRRLICFCLTCLLLGTGLSNRPLWAAPVRQIVTVQGPTLQGDLPYQYNAHYFGLAPTLRDAVIGLTLTYEPQNNPNLKGLVNFFVLDEDGLRRFLAGSDPQAMALAAGAPLQFDPIGNKVRGAFRASGRGQYTVVVYNNALLPVHYTLTADGGLLTDNANQTTTTAAQAEPTAAPTPSPAATVTESINPLGSASGQRLTGTLSNTIGRHYLSAVPTIRDGTIFFNFHYDPLDQPLLHGNVNFWVLDEAGLNAIIRGDKPGDVNLATGFPVPFSPFPNELQANFNASGKEPYTVVVYNQTAIPATYEMVIDGGTLADRYGQTTEAKSAAAALVTSSTNASAPAPTATPALTLVSAESQVTQVETPVTSLPLGVPQLIGNFTGAYQYHYFSLQPTLRDGAITLSLAFSPSDSKALRENLNFWVLTEDGLRHVLAGAPPSAYEIASGAYQEFGPYKGQLAGAFNTSGHGNYTVIVFSNVDAPARYLLTAVGGVLATENGNVALP